VFFVVFKSVATEIFQLCIQNITGFILISDASHVGWDYSRFSQSVRLKADIRH